MSEYRDSSAKKSSNSADRSDLQRAMAQLEEAIQELVRSARDDWSDRATSLLDETTRRIRGEPDKGGTAGHGYRYAEPFEEPPPRTRRLFKDPHNRRIAGVCAGFARYFGVETWVARLIAVTGLLFMPSIVLPAYFIAYLLLDEPGRARPERVNKLRKDHRSPAPEFGARHAPRRSLRQVHADLTDAELKLRRIETHVTSDQYALRRELDALDRSAT